MEHKIKRDFGIPKKPYEERTEKEKLLFLALCNEKDRELINGKEKLNLRDFERMTYLLATLGFNDYLLDFQLEHEDLMVKLVEKIEDDLNRREEADSFVILDIVNRWSRNFCDQMPDCTMKYYMELLFDLDEED